MKEKSDQTEIAGSTHRCGPLSGTKFLEFAGLGPAPFCGMLLSDLGADVIRIDRPGVGRDSKFDITSRGRRSIELNLKDPDAVEICLRLMEKADGVFEGFRPGVMERLGLGPDVALKRNQKLVYGRITGWGQFGPNAAAAGHDINYIAISGALDAIGIEDKPLPPLNLVGDFGGGAMYLAFGLLAGVICARETGRGQVVDSAMTDGAASLMALIYGMAGSNRWKPGRQSNVLDGAAHYYNTYKCADGRWISIAASEPKFYAVFLKKLGITDPIFADQGNRENWPALRQKIAEIFELKTQEEWCAILEGTDVCFAPILNLQDAPLHPHNVARQTFLNLEGVTQPAPAPRFSVTPGAIQGPPPKIGSHNTSALADWGVSTQGLSLFEA